MRKEAAKWQEMEETRVFLQTQVAQSRFAKQQEATRADSLAAQVCCHPARSDPAYNIRYCARMLPGVLLDWPTYVSVCIIWAIRQHRCNVTAREVPTRWMSD